ncbi:RNA polymerase sigma factor [Actinophytocola glycyrrhizae]|uniref:RNA polymerase sigma factor n=1 Tax=Actinophytocola glycyrrhizae TaxID=2044873 RepID=A0ABV9S8S1_9PSEU
MTTTRSPVGSGAAPPGSSPADERLLADSLHEPERFSGLFDRYAPVVHGYLSRRVGTLADDLLSETFLLAFRGRDGYDPARGPVRAWLFGIATNLLRRHARDEERRYRAFGRAAAALAPAANEFDTSTASRVDAQALVRTRHNRCRERRVQGAECPERAFQGIKDHERRQRKEPPRAGGDRPGRLLFPTSEA